MYSTRFELKYEPTNLKQIAKWPYWFGIILFLLTAFIFMLGQYLPLELYVVYIFELVDELIFHLLTLGTISTALGYVLDKLSWRKGKLTYSNDSVIISGKKSVYFKFDSILDLTFDNSKRMIDLNTKYYRAKIKFSQINNFEVIKTLLNERTRVRTAA
jgi:hypothetical protein